MSALDASQDREGHEIDSGGRSESDDEFDQDSVAIGNLAAAARAKLADQLLASGRADSAVEAAFRGVPRHTFLPEMDPVEAYQDRAVVIKSDSEGLPVSASTQPTMMAVMLSQLGLAAGHRVLETGTGTGHNAALIARIVGDQKSVVTIDVVPDLIGRARVNLTAAGYGRVTVVCGDGAAGVPDHAPYDRIVTTGTWDLATQWWAQLGPAGRIVLPLSIRGIQLSVGLETARLTAALLGRTRERQTRGTGWPQFLWVFLRRQRPARAPEGGTSRCTSPSSSAAAGIAHTQRTWPRHGGDHDARCIRRRSSADPGCRGAVASRVRCTAPGTCTGRDT